MSYGQFRCIARDAREDGGGLNSLLCIGKFGIIGLAQKLQSSTHFFQLIGVE
jgi:hypothetical protein